MTPSLPVSLSPPSPILERPVICRRSCNSAPPPHLVLDYVQSDRIAIMRHSACNSAHHPDLANRPLLKRSTASKSHAHLIGSATDTARRGLVPRDRQPLGQGRGERDPRWGLARAVEGGRGVSGHWRGRESGGGPTYSNRGKLVS